MAFVAGGRDLGFGGFGRRCFTGVPVLLAVDGFPELVLVVVGSFFLEGGSGGGGDKRWRSGPGSDCTGDVF